MAETFDCEIQARLRDINLGGHVDNVEAIRVLDEARLLFFRHADLVAGPRPGLIGRIPGHVSELVGSQRVDYNAEMRFAAYQPFLVRLWVSRIGRSSFAVSSELRVEADHPPALVADTTLVFWDGQAQRSWAMDDAVRSDLERFLGDPVTLR